jgi:crossover junction endodeoxyribonuclease RuvC
MKSSAPRTVSAKLSQAETASSSSTQPDCGITNEGDFSVISAAVHVGVDPGLSGALAFYDEISGDFNVVDMPTKWTVRNGKRRRRIDAVELGLVIDKHTAGRPVSAYIEQVGAMPGQGVTSMFSFGRAVGVVEGEFGYAGITPTEVPPRVWQKAVGLDPKSGKGVARQRAAALYPNHAGKFARNKDDGRADAALILHYGLNQETRQ